MCWSLQQKVNECMRTGNLVSRLQAKYSALRKALGEEGLRDVPHVTLGRFDSFVSVNHLQYYCPPLLSKDIFVFCQHLWLELAWIWISAQRVCNSLPVSIHESQSLPTFRRHLKTSYFQSAYPLFSCPPCLEYLRPRTLILLRRWRCINM